MHADEDHGQTAEEAVQVEHPVRPDAAGGRLGRDGQAPQDARGEQRPADDPAGAGRVPPDLLGHLVASCGRALPGEAGANPSVVSSRPSPCTASASARRVEQVEAAVPSRGACTPWPAPRRARPGRRSPRRARRRCATGVPVRGSMTWVSGSPSICQRRSSVVLVATAPQRRPTRATGSAAVGWSMSIGPAVTSRDRHRRRGRRRRC